MAYVSSRCGCLLPRVKRKVNKLNTEMTYLKKVMAGLDLPVSQSILVSGWAVTGWGHPPLFLFPEQRKSLVIATSATMIRVQA